MTRKKFKIPMKGDITKDTDTKGVVEECAVCGETLGDSWVVIGDGRVIHYGGKHELNCYRRAQP